MAALMLDEEQGRTSAFYRGAATFDSHQDLWLYPQEVRASQTQNTQLGVRKRSKNSDWTLDTEHIHQLAKGRLGGEEVEGKVF
jgi:hypothetical protein